MNDILGHCLALRAPNGRLRRRWQVTCEQRVAALRCGEAPPTPAGRMERSLPGAVPARVAV